MVIVHTSVNKFFKIKMLLLLHSYLLHDKYSTRVVERYDCTNFHAPGSVTKLGINLFYFTLTFHLSIRQVNLFSRGNINKMRSLYKLVLFIAYHVSTEEADSSRKIFNIIITRKVCWLFIKRSYRKWSITQPFAMEIANQILYIFIIIIIKSLWKLVQGYLY